MVCQCRFVSCHKCTTPVGAVDNGGDCAYGGGKKDLGNLCFLFNFVMNLKLLLKNSLIFKRFNVASSLYYLHQGAYYLIC